MNISIVALGPSSETYVRMMEDFGNRKAFCDETWVVNSYISVLAHERAFHMDDVRIQEQRAKTNPKLARMLDSLKQETGPIYTSRPHDDYPALIAFPLEDVINSCGTDYFNCTPSYAIAYALYVGATQINLFGLDFTWPNAHDAEQGRACCEYWIGRAMQRGVKVFIPDTSTLMDAGDKRRLYGYDTLDVSIDYTDGKAKVTMTPLDSWPSVGEIERRYDHSKELKHG